MPHPTPLNLEHQFSSLSCDSTQPRNDEAPSTTTLSKDVAPSVAAVVTPTKEDAEGVDTSFLSLESKSSHEEESQGASDNNTATDPAPATSVVSKTDHKVQEEQGLFHDEPLLKANPHRFVIFPIQDNEVSKNTHEACHHTCCSRLPYISIVRRVVISIASCFVLYFRFGKCTSKQKHRSGHRKRLI